MHGGLREQHKARTRQRLVQVALSLFEERGFDEVTVEEIAEVAVVSPRTFYRYFGTKEAVLYGDQDDQLALLHDAITSHPTDEPPLAAVRAGVLVLARQATGTAELHLRRARISGSTTSLGDHERTTLVPRWEEALTTAVAEHLGVDADTDARPRLLAGIGIAVMVSVKETFLRVGDADLEALVLDRFAELTELIGGRAAVPVRTDDGHERRTGTR
jgi:AcrR family transcriptional regulator